MSIIFTSYPAAFWTGAVVGACFLLVSEFVILFVIAMKQSKGK